MNYNLPDIQVLESDKDYDFMLWRPDTRYIVLGRANNVESSVFTDMAQKDRVEIIKRPSGGESVILTPSMLVFSAKITMRQHRNPSLIFEQINKNLISSLTILGIKDLHSKGISDISIGDKKIIGSSMYLKDKTLFYHAVLNINEDVRLISRYLKHPLKEPQYRAGRPHKEFVTSLHNEGYRLDYLTVETSINSAFTNLFSQFGTNVK